VKASTWKETRSDSVRRCSSVGGEGKEATLEESRPPSEICCPCEHLRRSGSGRGRGARLRGEREGHGPRESEGGARAVLDGEKRVRRGVMRETLAFIFILGHIYGHSLGLLGLCLFYTSLQK